MGHTENRCLRKIIKFKLSTACASAISSRRFNEGKNKIFDSPHKPSSPL